MHSHLTCVMTCKVVCIVRLLFYSVQCQLYTHLSPDKSVQGLGFSCFLQEQNDVPCYMTEISLCRRIKPRKNLNLFDL